MLFFLFNCHNFPGFLLLNDLVTFDLFIDFRDKRYEKLQIIKAWFSSNGIECHYLTFPEISNVIKKISFTYVKR